MEFEYETAFARNIGWLTHDEQQILRGKCVAIAGMGGAGGHHLLTLTRLGIGSFRISDLDKFELGNFNRQTGSSIFSIGKPKVNVLRDIALDINPELDIEVFPNGVYRYNMQEFLRGADIFVDGFDVFAIEPRRNAFAMCQRANIPAITAAPLGMGSSCISFATGGMTFEKYFRMEGHSPFEQMLRFLAGLSPSSMHAKYITDFSTINFVDHIVPSTTMGCSLATGWIGSQVLKILLKRNGVKYAPHLYHFDAYLGKVKHTWRPFGNNNPLQRLLLSRLRKRMKTKLSR